jgi:Uma2 family endonuclease
LAGVHKKQGEYTIEDYFALPDGDRKELIDGVFYDMATPLTVHQDIVGYMHLEIGNFIRKNKGKCKVFVAPSAVRLDSDKKTMVEPDIYIVCDKDKIKRFGNYGAPDFVLEVLSDSTRKKDLGIKVYKYINAGVRELWYIDVKTRKLLTYFEGDDYMPTVHPLEGMLGLSIYDGKLQINLSEIGDIIEEYSAITDPD